MGPYLLCYSGREQSPPSSKKEAIEEGREQVSEIMNHSLLSFSRQA